MKILCLPTEAFHVLPLMRSQEELRARGVELTFVECNSFAKACQNLDANYDALLVHQVLLCDEVFACGPPVVILERIDGAQLAGARPWVHRSVGVIKGYTFRDRELNNTVCGRQFPHLLVAAGVGPTDNTRALHGVPQPQLSSEDLAKLRVGYGFPSYASMDTFVAHPPNFDELRTYGLHWVGTVSYKGTEIELHRQQALDVVASWSGPSVAAAGRPYVLPEYQSQLRQSYCVLSPWGWGEPCFRDVEAMLTGAVLIKPDTDYVQGWPDIYRNGETYRACKADLSDVHDIAADVIQRWDNHRALRERARAICVDAWRPEAIAERMASVFGEVLR